jgi:hypothetical protein
MRDHSQIIEAAGGDEAVATELDVPLNTVRAWKQRNRISHTRWAEFVNKGWTTFEELSANIEPKRAAA